MKTFISGTEITDPTLAYMLASVRWPYRRFGNGLRPYCFLRRYSKTTYPVSADIAEIAKFVRVKILFKARARLFPCPFVAVNSLIKRSEYIKKTRSAVSTAARQSGIKRLRPVLTGSIWE